MLGSIFFLFLAAFLIYLSQNNSADPAFDPEEGALNLAVGGYLLCFGLISLQNRLFGAKREWAGALLIATNCYLLSYLLFSHSVPSIRDLYPSWLSNPLFYAAPSLCLYLSGIFLHVASSNCAQMKSKSFFSPSFLLFCFFTGALLSLFPPALNSWKPACLFFFILLSISLFFHKVFLCLLGCRPLEDQELLNRLEQLAKRARFSHSGLLIWEKVGSATAALLGIFPKFRYVLFSKKLLDGLSPSELEAVFSHEIGHGKRGHLLQSALIGLGMLLASGLFIQLLSRLFSFGWLLFFLSAAFIAFYLRFILGYFSRLFEREADLYVHELGIPQEHLASALDRIVSLSGVSPKRRSSRYFSIEERIAFLQRTALEPRLIKKHERKVRRALLLHLGWLLILSSTALYLAGCL